jgi:short-subunit dehydrogenase
LINNAGYMMIAPCETSCIEKVEQLFNINVFSPMRMVNAVMPIMRQQNCGHIINIGSTSGIQATPGLGVFSASKYALEGYTQALAVEALFWNIKVTMLEVGTVNTPWINNCEVDSHSEVLEYSKIIDQLMQRLLVKTSEAPCGEIVAKVISKTLNESISGIRLAVDTNTETFMSNILVDPSGQRYLKQQHQFLAVEKDLVFD